MPQVTEQCISKMESTDESIKPFLITGEEKDKDRIQPRETLDLSVTLLDIEGSKLI
ncbi:hypothetical protein Csa_000013 [Cucumis sativus]|uniref:Uncharacterized protein n=1 Tax=Cucumis sativus TaxID=3659 RepID=A0A0A0KNG6_CUCSA|nr:hypothetical protein Csa_000013 [Cucumis sativus]